MTPTEVEAVARALCRVHESDADPSLSASNLQAIVEDGWKYHRKLAKVAIAALDKVRVRHD